jgi:ribose transport system substrate-binding protein
MSMERIRNRWFIQIAMILAALLVIGQVAVAQESTPTAAQMEGDATVRSMDPSALPDGWTVPEDVGHVTNFLMHEWYQNLTAGEEVRAAEYGINFSINDANLDLPTSLAAVDDYVAQGIDVLNFTPVQEEASGPKITEVAATGLPIICESSPADGCSTLVSIDDYAAGFKVGVWAGEYVNENLGGQAVVLDVGYPALTTTVARSTGFMDGITSILGENATLAQSVDSTGVKDIAVTVAADALTAHPDVNVIFGINDDSALGGMQSYEAAGLDMENLLVVGFGCEGNACKDALAEGGPYKVSAAMFPEYQGRLMIDAGVAAFNGVELPPHLIAPSTPITADNLADYYTLEGEEYSANFDAIAEISTEGES